MTSLDDLDLSEPLTPANHGAPAPRPCRRHEWRDVDYVVSADRTERALVAKCVRCGRLKDAAASRRARNNRSRGHAIQRQLNRAAGISNIAGNAVNHDGGRYDEPFASEAKSGGAFPERLWRWLKGIPVTAGQTAILLVADAPGPGHRRRAVVVLDLADWRALHGDAGLEP